MLKNICLPILWTNNDINSLKYPEDIQIGMYVWDKDYKEPVLITDSDSIELHISCFGKCSRERFATIEEINKYVNAIKDPSIRYNTVCEYRAFRLSQIIYNI